MTFDFDKVAPKCRICNIRCDGVKMCSTPGTCIFEGVASILMFAIVGGILFYKLIQFFRTSSHRTFTLKRIIYIFGLCGCLLRILRFALLFGETQNSVAGLWVDDYLYWYAFGFFFLMYASLLAFWHQTSSRTSTIPKGWLSGKMITLCIIASTCVFIIMTVLPIVSNQVGGGTASIICNIVAVIVVLSIVFMALFEGHRLRKLFKLTTLDSKAEIFRTVTRMAVWASLAMSLAIVVLIIGTIFGAIYRDSLVRCNIQNVLYRITEVIVVFVVAYPLGTNAAANQRTSGSSTKLGNSSSKGHSLTELHNVNSSVNSP